MMFRDVEKHDHVNIPIVNYYLKLMLVWPGPDQGACLLTGEISVQQRVNRIVILAIPYWRCSGKVREASERL